MKKLNKKGFTLTELIVVIAVIAILAAVLIPTLTGYIEKARISADNQEVAVLNKLLLGAEIDEVEFNSVPQLKKYLEEEMEYDGDYSLGVKGSYLFFNKEEYKFEIINESEVTGLANLANDSYTLVDTLNTPEGLLKNTKGVELLLVGGNGQLVEVVEEIRNLGNAEFETGLQVKEYIKLEEGSVIKSLFSEYFTTHAFSGTGGSLYEVDENGNVTINNETTKAIVAPKGDYSVEELREIFNNEVIKANLAAINEEIKAVGKLVFSDTNPYSITVEIIDENIGSVLLAVLDVVEMLANNGASTGYIIPKEFKTIDEYKVVLEKVINSEENQTDAIKAFKAAFVQKFAIDPDTDSVDDYCKVDISVFEEEKPASGTDFLGMIEPIYVALNLYINEAEKYDSKSSAIEQGAELLIDQNEIRLIGSINYGEYGKFEVIYDFKFDTSAIEK